MDEYIDFIHFQINSKGIAEEKQEKVKSEKRSGTEAEKEKDHRGAEGAERPGCPDWRRSPIPGACREGCRVVVKIPLLCSAVFYCYHLKGMLY